MIIINVCLDDIKFKKSEKNGKSYSNLVIDTRKEKDKFGNTHSVYNYVPQLENEKNQKPKEYCGNGKEVIFKSK